MWWGDYTRPPVLGYPLPGFLKPKPVRSDLACAAAVLPEDITIGPWNFNKLQRQWQHRSNCTQASASHMKPFPAAMQRTKENLQI